MIFHLKFPEVLIGKSGAKFHQLKKTNYIPITARALSFFGKELYSKIKRKFLQIFETTYKHNSDLKPIDAYNTSKEYFNASSNADVDYIEVYPDYVSTLPISEELYKACSNYAKPKLSVKTNYVIVKMPQGRVYTNNMGSVAIIGHDNKLIGDISFQYKDGKIIKPKDNIIFSQTYFLPPIKLPGTAFSMLSGGGAINNYGHWLMDVLPRIHLLQKSGLFNSVDWFIVPSLNYDYQRDSLKLLGIQETKLVEGDKYRHYQADTLIASTAPRGDEAIIPDWAFEYLRSSFLGLADNKQIYPSYIHISRKDSKFRNVLNEDELVELITPYGFETITLSKLSFIEKVNLFAHAEIILGASGAGLTNVFFSGKGSKLIELFSDGFILTDYVNLAHKAEMDHYYVINKSLSNVSSKKQGQREHLRIDLKELKKILERIWVSHSDQNGVL